jgi:hypothetical protein
VFLRSGQRLRSVASPVRFIPPAGAGFKLRRSWKHPYSGGEVTIVRDAAPEVREFEMTTPTGGMGFDISYSDRQVTSIYSNGKLVDCDITIQFQRPDKQSRHSTGIEVKVQRKKSNFIRKNGLDLTGQKEQLEMQYRGTGPVTKS